MKRKSIITILKIVISYLIIAGSYILFSDYYVASISNDQNVITRLQTYKGWGFVFISSIGLFLVLYKLFRNLNKEKEILFKAQSLLQKSEERYRLISSVASDYIFSSDVIEDGSLKLNWVSGSFEKITGYSFEEYTSLGGWVACLHPDDVEIDKLDMENLKNNRQVTTELRTISKSGDIIWVKVYAQPVWDNQEKKLIGIYGAVQDITERKSTELALLKSRKEFQSYFDSNSIGLSVTDSDKTWIEVNQRLCSMLGYTKSELTRHNWIEFTHPDDIAKNLKLFNDALNGDIDKYELEKRFIRKDGSIIFVILSAVCLRNTDGSIDHLLASYNDITERKLTELALLNEKERLKTILDQVATPIFLKDNDHRITAANRAFYDIFCTDEKNVIGLTLAEAVPDNERKQFLAADRKVLDIGITDVREEELTVNNFTRTIITRKSRYIDGFGNRFLVGSIFDITDRKLAEAALKESEIFAKTVVDALSSNLAILDETGVILAVNLAWRKFGIKNTTVGSNLELCEGVNYLAVCDNAKGPSSEGAKEAAEGIRSVISDKLTEFSLTYSCNSPYEERWFILRVTRFPGQGAARVVVAHENITERILAELKLKENEEIFNQLMQHSPIHIFFKDENIRPIRLSSNYEKMLKMPIENLIGKNMNELFPSELAKNMVEDDKKILSTGKLVKVDEEFDGRFYNTIKFPIKIEGKPQYLAGFTIDVTENKRAEDALRESEERFHSMFKNHNAVMILLDPESGQIIDANYSAEKYYGYSIEKLKQLNISEINVMPREELEIRLRNSTLISRSHHNFPHKLSSGEIRLVEDYTSPISVKGKIVLFSIIQDITERKKAEQEVFESQEKLRALTARLERVQEEERINLSRELHDHLGQNLTGLKMDTAWLAKKIQSDTPIESDDLLQKTNGMLLLIDELIRNVRKISAELRPNVLDYLGLIPAIEWQMDELKKRTDIDCVLKSNVQKIDLGVQINSSIFRIIQEAFTNVIRHSGATKIEVSITDEEDFLKLEILDNGIGINENNISNLHSLGILGMRERTLQFNGKLHLENAEHGGTLLTLIIPKKN